jgi:hypothetical protein
VTARVQQHCEKTPGYYQSAPALTRAASASSGGIAAAVSAGRLRATDASARSAVIKMGPGSCGAAGEATSSARWLRVAAATWGRPEAQGRCASGGPNWPWAVGCGWLPVVSVENAGLGCRHGAAAAAAAFRAHSEKPARPPALNPPTRLSRQRRRVVRRQHQRRLLAQPRRCDLDSHGTAGRRGAGRDGRAAVCQPRRAGEEVEGGGPGGLRLGACRLGGLREGRSGW